MIYVCHVGLKTLWEKKTLLATSIFSFSHNVFNSYISLVHHNAAVYGNVLIKTKGMEWGNLVVQKYIIKHINLKSLIFAKYYYRFLSLSGVWLVWILLIYKSVCQGFIQAFWKKDSGQIGEKMLTKCWNWEKNIDKTYQVRSIFN